ncbi:MAG TPA: thioredoxin domain-containing protein [Candidatus Binatia bacterium]|nr:thioredoxin domain-containing protein [Candidatus Binatia bacterium]
MRRSPRTTLLAGLLVLCAWTAGCSSSPGDRSVTLDGAMARGPSGAPVTIVEFSDYECPYCKRTQGVIGQLMDEYPGKIRLVFKDFPLHFHPGARPAAEAARCAGASGRFWEYHDLLFVAQPAFSRTDLLMYARRLDIDQATFAACLDAGRFRPLVQRDLEEGRALGVRGTPTFFVNGQRLVGAQPIESFREAVDQALRDARPR